MFSGRGAEDCLRAERQVRWPLPDISLPGKLGRGRHNLAAYPGPAHCRHRERHAPYGGCVRPGPPTTRCGERGRVIGSAGSVRRHRLSGLGCCHRSTETSWRSTSSLASFDAERPPRQHRPPGQPDDDRYNSRTVTNRDASPPVNLATRRSATHAQFWDPAGHWTHRLAQTQTPSLQLAVGSTRRVSQVASRQGHSAQIMSGRRMGMSWSAPTSAGKLAVRRPGSSAVRSCRGCAAQQRNIARD